MRPDVPQPDAPRQRKRDARTPLTAVTVRVSVRRRRGLDHGRGSSDPEGPIASYSWDFGDGSLPGSGAQPSHPYATAGTYQVTLTVTDGAGATDPGAVGMTS
jgi:hypothetical protein